MKFSNICRRFVSAGLLLVYLLSATACREWLKLPALFSHFTVAASANGQVGFIEFLHDHYWHEDDAGKDASDDARLPFHSGEYNNALQFASPEPQAVSGYILRPVSWYIMTYSAYGHHDMQDGYFSGIWQPPRTV